jgi:hypothetical protein
MRYWVRSVVSAARGFHIGACGKAQKNLNVHKVAYGANLSIVVVRVNSTGDLADSAPCASCINFIRYVGIRKIHYSTDTGSIHTVKTKDYVPKTVSKGFRKVLEQLDEAESLAVYIRDISRHIEEEDSLA